MHIHFSNEPASSKASNLTILNRSLHSMIWRVLGALLAS